MPIVVFCLKNEFDVTRERQVFQGLKAIFVLVRHTPEQQNAELTAKLNWFMEQLQLGRHRKYGASSKQSHAGEKQLSLFNEAEVEAQPMPAEPTVEKITYECRKKKSGQREALLKDLLKIKSYPLK